MQFDSPVASAYSESIADSTTSDDESSPRVTPADLPTVHQFGVRPHRHHARPVRAFAENQPVTSIVNAIQALFAQESVGNDIWVALGWCLGILALAYVLAMTLT